MPLHPGDDAITPTQGDGHKSVVEHLGGAPEVLVAASSDPLWWAQEAGCVHGLEWGSEYRLWSQKAWAWTSHEMASPCKTENHSPPLYSTHMLGKGVGAGAIENIKIFILLPFTLFISFFLPFQLKWTLPIFFSLTFCLFRIFVGWWVEHPARSVNT